jgi:diguanylate cyclase (GGDEF)-like protein
MRPPAPPLSSNQPDLRVLTVLGTVQRAALVVTTAIAGVILLAWLIGPLGRLLPTGWALMKLNTALVILFSGFSVWLSQPRRSALSLLASRLLAFAVAVLCAATLLEYAAHLSLHIDTLLAADSASPIPGRMSVQTAWGFLVLGLVAANIRARKGLFAHLIDALTLVMSLLTLVFIAAYIYGALSLFGVSLQHRLSPQTLICLTLLAILVFNRRTEYGVYSTLLGSGIAGKTTRLAAPAALVFPFLLSVSRGLIVRFHLLPVDESIALAASTMSLLGFCLVLVLGRKTHHLENAIRELSLRDELTRLYNRRGFYVLAEQALRLAQRAGSPFFVLFIDMDNLKIINDTLGHEVGSERLVTLAQILEQTFRETDVIGRLGGDEFVVAGRADAIDLDIAATRLEETAAQANQQGGYPISFSLGYVNSRPRDSESLEHLIERADSIMYEAKRKKKHTRGAPLQVTVP